MAHSATVTAHLGPGKSAAALVLNNVTKMSFDHARKVLQVFDENDNPIEEFDLSNTATITATLTGVNWAWVVSS